MGCGASSASSIEDKHQKDSKHKEGEKKDHSHEESKEEKEEKHIEDSEAIQNVDRAVNELKEYQEEQEDKEAKKKHTEEQEEENNQEKKKKKKKKKDDSSDSDSDEDEEAERVGTFFLVTGPSGAGKDSLVKGARSVIGNHEDYHFVKMYITRSDNEASEEHISVSMEDFDKMVENKEFSLHWKAHGHGYGIGKHIKDELQANKNVIAVVSREMITKAQKRFKKHNVVVVEVNVHNADIIRERLTKRGRESTDEIEERIQRNSEMADLAKNKAKNLKTVWNNSSLDEGVDKFLAAVQYLPEDMLGEEEEANETSAKEEAENEKEEEEKKEEHYDNESNNNNDEDNKDEEEKPEEQQQQNEEEQEAESQGETIEENQEEAESNNNADSNDNDMEE